MRNVMPRLVAIWVSLLVVACGGGGGGTQPGGGGPTGASTTGLLPQAPAPGATLYADASVLRPIRDGATWNYRGVRTLSTGASSLAYTTSTSQAAANAFSATETSTNSANGGTGAQPLSISNGVVGSLQAVDFAGTGNAQQVNFIELRSPVRAGDQYTIIDKRFTDTAADADGDGKADALDVVAYARVAGRETISLPNLPAMQAVRVDTTVLSRVIFSSNGQPSAVVQATLQTWYVAGIGIVRQTSSTPSGNGVANTDEQLRSWDGISGGLGAMDPAIATIPATSTVFPGQTLPVQTDVTALAFGDHALVFVNTPDISSPDELAVTVDLRGKVTSSHVLPGLRGAKFWSATSDGAVYIEPVESGGLKGYTLTRVDSNGALVGAVRGTALDNLYGSHVTSAVYSLAAAVDGTTLWLLWERFYYDPGNGALPATELVLRPFSLDGAALAPETIVEQGSQGSLQISASGGRVLMSWTSGSGHDVVYASTSLGGPLSVRTLATDLPSASVLTPLQLNGYDALMWPLPLGSFFSVGTSGGVLLDSNLMPIRSGATLLDEQLGGVLAFSRVSPSALGSRIVVTATQSGVLLWPTDLSPQSADAVTWIDVSGAALALTPASAIRFATVQPQAQAVFPDRVLVFGIGLSGLTTTVVWLNNGAS